MPKEYSKEEAWKLYEKLPRELKEVVFAEETANNVYNICERNGVKDRQISEVARYTGRVLLGILPPEDFQNILKEELKLEGKTAEGVGREISRLIFYPIKTGLEELYKTEIEPLGKARVPSVEKLLEEVSPADSSLKRKPKETIKDIYREPTE